MNVAIGYGSYGYEPNVDYFFGFPRAIEPGGVVMNVRLGDYVASHDNDPAQRVHFRQQIGMLSSALEHAIPEQMFVRRSHLRRESVGKSHRPGPTHLPHYTRKHGHRPAHIHHDVDTMDEIREALAVGKEVITHTDAVTVPGWKGAGYIIMDRILGLGRIRSVGG